MDWIAICIAIAVAVLCLPWAMHFLRFWREKLCDEYEQWSDE
jgi:hypothetical protein